MKIQDLYFSDHLGNGAIVSKTIITCFIGRLPGEDGMETFMHDLWLLNLWSGCQNHFITKGCVLLTFHPMKWKVKDRQLLVACILQWLHKFGCYILWLQCILSSCKLVQSHVYGVCDDII